MTKSVVNILTTALAWGPCYMLGFSWCWCAHPCTSFTAGPSVVNILTAPLAWGPSKTSKHKHTTNQQTNRPQHEQANKQTKAENAEKRGSILWIHIWNVLSVLCSALCSDATACTSLFSRAGVVKTGPPHPHGGVW